MIFITILIFIFIFSALVLIHEWGHFTMARKAGIKVEEFGIGLPPRAKAIYKDKQGTIYSLNWIPFGGYVRLFGEDSTDNKILKAGDSYASKTKLQRASVVVAGVVMNFFLAWLLLTIGFTVGMKPIITQDQLANAEALGLATIEEALYVSEVNEGSPAEAGGLLPGDVILELNDEPAPTSANFSTLLEPNMPVTLEVMRMTEGGEEENMTLQMTANETGKIGVSITDSQQINPIIVKLPIHKAAWRSVEEVGRLSYLTVDMLGDVVVSLVAKFSVPDGVAGPVGIFKMTQESTQQGIIALLQLTALLSISLAVINIMPFPALDGGRLLFIIFEAILGKKPNAKWEAAIHGIGFILLISLILIITWNDIMNLFR